MVPNGIQSLVSTIGALGCNYDFVLLEPVTTDINIQKHHTCMYYVDIFKCMCCYIIIFPHNTVNTWCICGPWESTVLQQESSGIS